MKGDEIVRQTKPWLSGNMLLNINAHKNGGSIFFANLRVVEIKSFELTQFESSNLSIYCKFVLGEKSMIYQMNIQSPLLDDFLL